jgi:polyribonucleotide nucleotidyltransferase
MKLNRKVYKTEVDGSPLELEVSELAGQANAAVLGRWGDTVVLATVVMGKEDVSLPYFPLTVDYEERFYAAGKILGSRFVRREGRPSDEATLSARLIDRTIRPLFDHKLRREVQVVVTVMAYDEEHDPDLISLLAVSTALSISDVPWGGPVAGARFVRNGGEDKALEELAFFAGTEGRINMIEFEGKEVAEDVVVAHFEKAQKEITRLVEFQNGIMKELGKKKVAIEFPRADPKLKKQVEDFAKKDLVDAIQKKELGDLKHLLFEHLRAHGENEDAIHDAGDVFEEVIDEHVHELALKEGKRVDGRRFDEVRELNSEVGLFRRTHGSGLFMRGTTQVLSVATLAPPSGAQLVETMEERSKKRFMLHYNFPDFSVGETGRARSPGRREIGHGTLASKAVRNLIPDKEKFPYAIRIVAETLSSNGSSSMASACSASLALMDAGVPLPRHVAGIAMGLMMNEEGEYKVLTDIQGPEDHHGDMDLKVAGTSEGVTAVQMDVKVEGITQQIFVDGLAQAKEARLHILKEMEGTIKEPRSDLSEFAPRILTLTIDPERIGEVIGPGGKMINGIIDACGGPEAVSIDIEEDGTVFVSSGDKVAGEKALAMVANVVREYKQGDIVEGDVVKVLDFGAIVEFGSRDGMVHVSELAEGRTEKVEDVIKVGDHVWAKVVRVEHGKIGLSLKGVPQQK